MTDDAAAVLVFGQDGEVYGFASAAAAASELESVDVLRGEYVAAYAVDGQVLELTGTDDHRVMISHSPTFDLPALVSRLAEAQPRATFRSSPASPREVALELILRDRRGLWPRGPTWLHRRIHGTGPA